MGKIRGGYPLVGDVDERFVSGELFGILFIFRNPHEPFLEKTLRNGACIEIECETVGFVGDFLQIAPSPETRRKKRSRRAAGAGKKTLFVYEQNSLPRFPQPVGGGDTGDSRSDDDGVVPLPACHFPLLVKRLSL